jgi:hypothetical protein
MEEHSYFMHNNFWDPEKPVLMEISKQNWKKLKKKLEKVSDFFLQKVKQAKKIKAKKNVIIK